MISRKEMYEEFILRENIQKTLRSNLESKIATKRGSLIEELTLRSHISSIILEAVQDPNDDPHPSTGINYLKGLFKNTNFLATLEEAYKFLTSSYDQRKSFSEHVIQACELTLSRLDSMESEEEIQEVDLEIDADPPGFVDQRNPSAEEKEEEEREEFNIDGEDETGRNSAFQTYKKIEKSIIDQYVSMGDPQDRRLFKQYLLLNLEHYFKQWESELDSNSPQNLDPI
jgi:hypothetical protein